MTVLERSELDASPLADLHAIADQIGLDGFRRLRKADLIDAILDRSGGGTGRGERRRWAWQRRRGRGRQRSARARRTCRRTAHRRRARRRRWAGRRRGGGGGRGGLEQRGCGRGPRDRRRAQTSPDALTPLQGCRRRSGARVRGCDGARGGARESKGWLAACSGGPHRRGRGRAARQRLGFPAGLTARGVRRGRLHLRRAGAPLRTGVRRPRGRPGTHPTFFGALPLAGARGHDQWRPRGVGRGGHPLRGSRRRPPLRASGARSAGSHARGDRMADPDRPRLAREHRRRGPLRQDRDAAAPARRAHRRARAWR